MPKSNNIFKQLMNTRKAAVATALPKGVTSIKEVMKEVSQTPYYLTKTLKNFVGGKSKRKTYKKSRMNKRSTRKH